MTEKRKMLFVTNLHFDKNGNGGQQRTYYLIKELSKSLDLIVLSPYSGSEDKVIDIEAEFLVSKGIATRKASQKNIWTRVVFKIQNVWLSIFHPKYCQNISLQPIVCYQMSQQIKKISKKSKYEHLNTIVFDILSTVVPLDKNTIFGDRILNAHNFDFELAKADLEAKIENQASKKDLENTTRRIELLKKYEHHIDTYFTEIWVCSKEDEIKFRKANPNTNVKFYNLPNGSDTDARPLQVFQGKYNKFLFVGSLNYKPNYSGLKWFVNSIFKHLDGQFQLDIVGRYPNPKNFGYVDEYSNINLIGEVDNLENVYQSYDIMVVPLLEGSGTRLKILEAMSYGKLVLSTPKGIEGIDAVDQEHYFEFNALDSFLKILSKLNNHSSEIQQIRLNGRKLIEDSFSWKGIVQNYLMLKFNKNCNE